MQYYNFIFHNLSIQIIEHFPKTPSGKVMRRVLRDRWFLQPEGEEVRVEEMEKRMRQTMPQAGMPMISCC